MRLSPNKNSGNLSGKVDSILNASDLLLLGSRNQQICQKLDTILKTATDFQSANQNALDSLPILQ